MPEYADLPRSMALRLEAQWLDARRAMVMTSAVRGVMIVLLVPVGIVAAVLTAQHSQIYVLGVVAAAVYAANVVLVAGFCARVRRGAGETISMIMSMRGSVPAGAVH